MGEEEDEAAEAAVGTAAEEEEEEEGGFVYDEYALQWHGPASTNGWVGGWAGSGHFAAAFLSL